MAHVLTFIVIDEMNNPVPTKPHYRDLPERTTKLVEITPPALRQNINLVVWCIALVQLVRNGCSGESWPLDNTCRREQTGIIKFVFADRKVTDPDIPPITQALYAVVNALQANPKHNR